MVGEIIPESRATSPGIRIEGLRNFVALADGVLVP
jgi:hypothetical protein